MWAYLKNRARRPPWSVALISDPLADVDMINEKAQWFIKLVCALESSLCSFEDVSFRDRRFLVPLDPGKDVNCGLNSEDQLPLSRTPHAHEG
jgi:hypothetical protein